MKDVIVGEAKKRGLTLNVDWELNDKSVRYVLGLLKSKFEKLNDLAFKFNIIPALKELQIQEGGSLSFMDSEYQKILDNADKISAEFKQQPKKLQYLKGVIIDL